MYTPSVSPTYQLWCFAVALAVGLALGVVYEVFRLVRLISPRGKILTFICDILFMSLASLVNFILTVVINTGIVRWYILLGQAVGFVAYMCTIGRVSGALFRLIRKVIVWILWVIFTPFRLLWSVMRKFFSKTAKKMKKIVKRLLKKRKRILYNEQE